MNWYEKLDHDSRTAINMLAGALDLPPPQEYESLSAYLHTVRHRLAEASALVRQAAKALNA